MATKQLTQRCKGFKAKVQEQADKMLRENTFEEKRVFERNWMQARRNVPLWGEIAKSW